MKQKMSTAVMVRTALLALIGFGLMQFDLRLPIFPGFLALDVSDLPGVIGAVTVGPVNGMLISLLKNVLDISITGTTTGGIGELTNFILGTSLVMPIGFVYQKQKNVKGYLLGCALGLPLMVVVAGFMNYFVLLPLFSRLFIPMEAIIGAANAINANVTDLRSFIIFVTLPFNVLKGGLTVVLGYVVYRGLKPVLKRLPS